MKRTYNHQELGMVSAEVQRVEHPPIRVTYRNCNQASEAIRVATISPFNRVVVSAPVLGTRSKRLSDSQVSRAFRQPSFSGFQRLSDSQVSKFLGLSEAFRQPSFAKFLGLSDSQVSREAFRQPSFSGFQRLSDSQVSKFLGLSEVFRQPSFS
jgi:hypothetical protein